MAGLQTRGSRYREAVTYYGNTCRMHGTGRDGLDDDDGGWMYGFAEYDEVGRTGARQFEEWRKGIPRDRPIL